MLESSPNLIPAGISNEKEPEIKRRMKKKKKKKKRWKDFDFRNFSIFNDETTTTKDQKRKRENISAENENALKLSHKKRAKIIIPSFHRRVLNELRCVRSSNQSDSLISLNNTFAEEEKSPKNSILNDSQTSAKCKLLQILSEDKKDENSDHDEKNVIESVKSDDKCEQKPNQSLFQRSSDFVRRSLRKIKNSTTTTTKATPSQEDSSFLLHNKTLASDSQDSGLGEDSDLEHQLSASTTIRTSTPLTKSSTSSANAPAQKKHVVIQEPSLSLSLLHRQRQLHRQEQQQQQRKISITTAKHEVVRILPSLKIVTNGGEGGVGGSVGRQWQDLNELAYIEVIKCMDCNETVVRMIFNTNAKKISQFIQELPGAEEVAEVIQTIYQILFFKWITTTTCQKQIAYHNHNKHLSIIIHNVQQFLILVVDVADLDMDNRLKFARFFRALLSESVKCRYQNLTVCLQKTRKLYIDFWCCLLCSPL